MTMTREHALAPFGSASCQVSYHYHSGLVPMATGSDSDESAGPQVMVRASDPFSGRSVVFRITRQGGLPTMPPITPADSNEVLISAVIKVAWPIKEAVGEVYLAEGEYHFAHKEVRVPGVNNLPIGRGPHDAIDPKKFFVSPTWFDTRPLVDSGSQTFPGGGRPPLQTGITD